MSNTVSKPSRCGGSSVDGRDGSMSRYRSLWRAVIMQAIVDSSSNSVHSRNVRYKSIASEWLEEGGTAFDEVCELADLDPGYVQARIRKTREIHALRDKTTQCV